jgi:hypothetical protein
MTPDLSASIARLRVEVEQPTHPALRSLYGDKQVIAARSDLRALLDAWDGVRAIALEEAAAVAVAHKSNPRLSEPIKRGVIQSAQDYQLMKEEIAAERRGERIAADTIASAIRSLITKAPSHD